MSIMVQVAFEAHSEPAPALAPAEVSPHDVLVGGTNSAFLLPTSACLSRAAGARIWDEDGREYADFLLASGPLILGHGHSAVVEAVSRQLSLGSAFYALNRPALELASALVDIPGCVETVRFASTGTEATMHAVRLARGYTGRDKVLVFEGGYHGSHDISIVSHRGSLRAQRGGVPEGVIADTLLARYNDIESVRATLEMHGDSVAAILVEPQQRSRDPLPGFLPELRELARRHGAVLVFDEVLTGFRLAYGGAKEYYGVEPDLVCYGKILGGGFPISAVGGPRDIMCLADPARAAASDFVHVSGTLSGNPVSCTAGLATLAQLREPGVYERLHYLGKCLRSGLSSAMADLGIDGEVYGSGPIAAVNFKDGAEPGSGAQFKSDVNREMILRGVLVQMQTRFYVSLAHSEDDIRFAVETFGDALDTARGQKVAKKSGVA